MLQNSILHKSTGNYQLFYNNLLTLLILNSKADYIMEPITQYIMVCTLTKILMENSLIDYLTNIPLTIINLEARWHLNTTTPQ
jgi:hypothetical protein